MKFKGLIFLLAVILSATAAPADSEKALLQAALDNEVDQVGMKTDVAAAESTGEQLLNLALDLANTYNRRTASGPSTKSAQAATDAFSKEDTQFSNDDASLGDDGLRTLPVGSFHLRTRGDSSTIKKPLCGRTDKPCTQRFLAKKVQDRYNTPIETGDDDLNAETEAIGALLAGAFKAFKAFKAIKSLKSLIPKSGSNSGDSDSDSNSGSSPGYRIPNGAPSRWNNYARNFLGFPDDIGGRRGTRTDLPQIESEVTEQNQEQAEIERYRKLRSFLGKALRVVNHKLRSRKRTPAEDRNAVNNPTGWKDLGRNLLGMIGDKLDPAERNPSLETDEIAREQVTDTAEEQKLKFSPKVRNKLLNMAQKLLERLKSRKTGGNKEATGGDDEAMMEYVFNFDGGHHGLNTDSEN